MSFVTLHKRSLKAQPLAASDQTAPRGHSRCSRKIEQTRLEAEFRNGARFWAGSSGRSVRRPAAANRGIATGLVLAILASTVFATAGCRQEPPLTIEPRYIDLGLVRRSGTQITVTLRAWDRGPVQIQDVTPYGGCVTPLEQLAGQVLQKGEHKVVTLMVTSNRTAQEQWFVWAVRTDPPGPTVPVPRIWGPPFFRPFSGNSVRRLPVSSLVVRGRFFPPPILSPPRMRLYLPVGQEYERIVEFAGYRPSEEAPIDVKVVPLKRTPIELIPVENNTTPSLVANGSTVMRDVWLLKLRVPSTLPLGQHEARFRLDVGRRWPASTFEVSVGVVEPLLFDQTILFTGPLDVGSPWKHTLHYQETTPDADNDVQVVSESEWLQAKLDRARDLLELKGVAPWPGRFEGYVRIDFGNDLPPLRIKVAGIGVAGPPRQDQTKGAK